jgi:hypothetical protein
VLDDFSGQAAALPELVLCPSAGAAFGSDAVAYVGEEFFTVLEGDGPATDWRRTHLCGDGHSSPLA